MKLKRIIASAIMLAALCSCSGWLDLRPTSTYSNRNVGDYPNMTRGYVEKAYYLMMANTSYLSNEYMYLDAATDDALFSLASNSVMRFATGSYNITSNPFGNYWARDYQAIYYTNVFLKDRVGINTQYLVDPVQDAQLRRYLQGDAFGMRAWAEFDLLRKFGGVDEKGELSGFCIMTEPVELEDMTREGVVRSSYDDCVKQILADCDSALVYLPLANRDFAIGADESTYIAGGIRYKALDRITVTAIKALVYLQWASPAFNPTGDLSRYAKAAECAAEVIKYKLDVEGPQGFDPAAAVQWTDLNSPEIIWRHTTDNTQYESYLYPIGFGGSATVVPSQNLVDAFPMANGYPITDSRSGYDVSNPYSGRDKRFSDNIFYHGSSANRNGLATSPMYTFDMTLDGADVAGKQGTSASNYYIKKFVFEGYNPYDATPLTQSHCVHVIRWTHMLLVYAEAASKAFGPLDNSLGLSAKDALAYIRSKTISPDPYLDECAADPALFEALVKNEWRLETCFEGTRFFNVRRWASDVSELNVTVYGASINKAGYINTYHKLHTLSFPSLWMPVPYTEFRKTESLTQNAGWESWK
ncbi:MAG: RagB/SusD family nutrient uptake outer membrane protein [Bacteroidales bacterium]|nr:RagB/SusD family nutrient uptake outer membrane protein [Bacteroidales bacterium]